MNHAHRRRPFRIACLVSLFLFGSGQAAIAAPVLTFDEATGADGGNLDHSAGWQFDVLAPLAVVGLGWFDDGADGLSLAHTIGIWDPAGILLASVLVPAGTASPLDGQFRTVSLAPIILPVAAGYIVGGENFSSNPERLVCGGGGRNCLSTLSQTVDSRIAFVDATFSPVGSGFQRPSTLSGAGQGFYGPSFSVVPEPAGALLVGMGLAGLAMRRRLGS